jgi:protocatechuate 3,4-dioxygenase beta subunit
MPQHDHDHGLAHDLNTLAASFGRRKALLWLAGMTAVPLVACGGGDDADSSSTSSTSSGSTDTSTGTGSSGSTTTSTCSVIPEETAGPYPGDGSNSNSSGVVNALALSGIVRSDIRTSFAGASGTAAGVPLLVNLRLVNTQSSCADLSGYAIYLWHCDREGRYSMYSSGVTDQNYLRGVQETDASGEVAFTTIFPGCYAGRMPHMHFEVYRSTATATSSVNKLRTSQLAFPDAVCDAVYATSGYSASVNNYASITFATDNVFSDGVTLQVTEVSGSVDTGYIATLTVGISA